MTVREMPSSLLSRIRSLPCGDAVLLRLAWNKTASDIVKETLAELVYRAQCKAEMARETLPVRHWSEAIADMLADLPE